MVRKYEFIFISGAKGQGKTTVLRSLHRAKTYNFLISSKAQDGFQVILPSKINALTDIIKQMHEKVGLVLDSQNKIQRLSPSEQIETVKLIEAGKKAYPSCKIECFDSAIKAAYASAGVKYDGFVLADYEISIMIDDVDKEGVECDDLVELFYNTKLYHVTEVLISQTIINTNYLQIFMSCATQYVFLPKCDVEQFMQLYQSLITRDQNIDLKRTYQALAQYQTLTLVTQGPDKGHVELSFTL